MRQLAPQILTTYDVYTPGTVSTFLPLLERTVENRRPDIFSVTQLPCNKAPFLGRTLCPYDMAYNSTPSLAGSLTGRYMSHGFDSK
jgi:hypothetical protein